MVPSFVLSVYSIHYTIKDDQTDVTCHISNGMPMCMHPWIYSTKRWSYMRMAWWYMYNLIQMIICWRTNSWVLHTHTHTQDCEWERNCVYWSLDCNPNRRESTRAIVRRKQTISCYSYIDSLKKVPFLSKVCTLWWLFLDGRSCQDLS